GEREHFGFGAGGPAGVVGEAMQEGKVEDAAESVAADGEHAPADDLAFEGRLGVFAFAGGEQQGEGVAQRTGLCNRGADTFKIRGGGEQPRVRGRFGSRKDFVGLRDGGGGEHEAEGEEQTHGGDSRRGWRRTGNPWARGGGGSMFVWAGDAGAVRYVR